MYKQRIEKQRIEKFADDKRSERQFQVGDMVYVKIQPYVQSSLAQRSNQKLASKFFGPYRVAARMGTVAYHLELPASSLVHPVFHVSQLKQAVGARHSVTTVPPSEEVLWSVPEHILQRRSIAKGMHSI
jgi:ribosomal protein L21E